jgi:hypothetical protein
MHFLQELREQGKIGLANWGEQLHSVLETEWWLQWLEWESLWATKTFPSDVVTWNIGPSGANSNRLMRTRSRMEAALREAIAKNGLTMLQLTYMHDLGITASLNLSLQDKESLIDTPQWKTLLKAEIQNSKNQLDAMAKKQTWQYEKKGQEERSKRVSA